MDFAEHLGVVWEVIPIVVRSTDKCDQHHWTLVSDVELLQKLVDDPIGLSWEMLLPAAVEHVEYVV